MIKTVDRSLKDEVSGGLGARSNFDTKMYPSDWRYSAAIVGLKRYFDYIATKEMADLSARESRYYIDEKEQAFYYNSEDVALDEKNDNSLYYEFAQHYFNREMHHVVVEKILTKVGNLSLADQKSVNEKLTANTVMKTIFKNIKCSEETRSEILSLIHENRHELIKKTFQLMKRGYANFANPNLMRHEKTDICRLIGFHVDVGRKTRGMSYNFDAYTFVGHDEIEFDFVPFAFSKTRESVFINNNYSIKDLIHSNDRLLESLEKIEFEEAMPNFNFRNLLFFTTKSGSAYLRYDVEVMIKRMDSSHYETMMVRKQAIKTFSMINAIRENQENKKEPGENVIVNVLNRPCRLSEGKEGRYLPIMDLVVEHILKHVYLDDMIEILLKDKSGDHSSEKSGYGHGFLIDQLIRINGILYKEEDVAVKSVAMQSARLSSKDIVGKLTETGAGNKIKAYRQKLISCLVFKNYDRFLEIMLQLSSYSQVKMPFLYDLAENFEENKNVAYVFVNGLENFEKKMGAADDFNQNKGEQS